MRQLCVIAFECVLAFALGTSVLAAGKTSSSSDSQETTSSDNREGKTFIVSLEPLGFTSLPGEGIRAGYFMGQNNILELGYAMSSGSTHYTTDSGSFQDGTLKMTNQLVELKAKHFFGNSFYIDFGFAEELWNTNYDVDLPGPAPGLAAGTKTLSGTATNTGVEFHVGNQWQFSGFTIGCDWVGYFLAIVSNHSYKSDPTVDPTDKQDEEKRTTKTVNGDSTHFARFYLGWSF